MVKRVQNVAPCRNVRNRVLVALPYSHLSQRKLAGIFRYVCECADWDLNIMPDGSLLTPEAFEIIANEGVDGVIVSADGVESALVEIAKRNIPAALIGVRCFPRTTDVVFVHTDESSIGREAALFFLKMAHWRSYGYVHAQNECAWDARRARAFSATLSRHAVKCHEFPGTVQSDGSSKALEIWLSVLPKPAAVFASDDYRAYQVISACKAVGIRVPTDVSVIGVGNTEVVCENSVPSISSIEPDYDNEGYLAAKHLDRIMSAKRPVKAEKVSGGVKGVVVRNSASNPKKWAGLLVQKALAYIRANVCRGISVPDVVAYLHVSRTLADLRFREVLGTTILNTIVDERLERTRNELMDSDESIACVCSRCGWKSENHPKKLFRAKYGQSMRAFRNSSRSGRLCTIGVAALVSLGTLSAMAEINIENEAFRPALSESSYATSPVCKERGEADLVNCRNDAPKRLADAPKMKPVLTVPHELDCLIESGHVQGACCSEQGVYLSHARGLEKIGWDGKLIKHVDAPSHLGDCAYADDKIYGAFVIRDKKVRKDGKRGLVRVWDENLNVLKEAWFDEALDGIVILGDTVYVGVDRWGKKSHPLCCVKRLDLNLNDLGNTDVDLGYDIAYGVQTMATDGKDLFFGSYGGTSRVRADLKENARIKFRCSEGFGLVPKSIVQNDATVFFVVHAMGGNMHGWRKDPENNPPRIRFDFFEFKEGNEFKDGKFEDISSASERTPL